ncbi:MAG TPA: DUF3052 domain-containing protein [Chthoniobacterales bacterium]
MAGYSETPLAQKLGIKPAATVVLLNGPSNYRKLLGTAAKSAKFANSAAGRPEFVHLFVTSRADLAKRLQELRKKLAETGMLWVSWPKKSSGVRTDVTEDVIRAVALPLNFVDVKVCAVDETWSGLKLVIRREHRKKEN